MRFLKLFLIRFLFTGYVKDFTEEQEVIAPIDVSTGFDF